MSMIVWAVGVYIERSGINEVKIVNAITETRAMQMAVDGYFDIDLTTVQILKNYYWDTKQITVSTPVFIRSGNS
jgi:hypothetical protein